MRLNSIVLENYRCFRDLAVTFQPGFNVIAGINGSGKTSILKGIREALTGYVGDLHPPGATLAPFAEATSARVQSDVTAGRYRFEEKYPVNVRAEGKAFGKAIGWTVTKIDQTGLVKSEGERPGRVWQSMQSIKAPIGAHEDLTLPVIAFYAAYRSWPPAKPDEMRAATDRASRMDGYRLWWEAASDHVALQQWAIGKSQERLQLSADRGVRWNDVRDDELAMVNVALATAVDGALGIRYDFTLKSLLIEWRGETPPTEFRNLSDGQRVAIALVVDIARRICLLNPHLGEEVTKKTPGVVLIDELDIHLHPKWQRLMTAGLQAAFPEVQFIAASHSPQVLGELKPEQIILLTQNGIAHPEVSYGLDASRVLEQIMEASKRPIKIEQELSTLFELLERNELAAARDLLDSLKQTAPGLPELAGAEALLKRKEVIGR
ncbi:MAG: AAA family ATPase [Trinickia sp.]|uniref:AAA family ATPase n=1 Tax=Trinickia sp. TaxID=2571163 RepID=UPI003F7D646E